MLYHFCGIAGAGMNPLARLMRRRGHVVQGSDRSFDRGENQVLKAILESEGIRLVPQGAAAITANLDRVVFSAAVEAQNPELVAAKNLNIPTMVRPTLLAEVVDAGCPGVAVCGTSGKSTVVGMIAWILQETKTPASILGGAALAVDGANHMGAFAIADAEAPVIAEACESDGTLIGYHPKISLLLNITRDHGELEGLLPQFETVCNQSRLVIANADCPQALKLAQALNQTQFFGTHPQAQWRLIEKILSPFDAGGRIQTPDGEIFISVPQPGQHTLENALAALALVSALGVKAQDAALALRTFPGVARRFQCVSKHDGIRVIDDYAHNGAKIEAAIRAAQLGADRVLAIFQPHGFGPARFLRSELKEILPKILRPQDRLCYAPIYYAGGTVAQDISSFDLASDLSHLKVTAVQSHAEVASWIQSQHPKSGDTILLMGARDPRLPELARSLLQV
jgi:UDP-N-acetylmuramate--alanine ligase